MSGGEVGMADAGGGADRATAALTAVVDRVVDGRSAVLLVGDDEQELVVPIALLPDGTGEGDVLRLGLVPDPAATAERRDALAGRLDALRRERGRPGRFDAAG